MPNAVMARIGAAIEAARGRNEPGGKPETQHVTGDQGHASTSAEREEQGAEYALPRRGSLVVSRTAPISDDITTGNTVEVNAEDSPLRVPIGQRGTRRRLVGDVAHGERAGRHLIQPLLNRAAQRARGAHGQRDLVRRAVDGRSRESVASRRPQSGDRGAWPTRSARLAASEGTLSGVRDLAVSLIRIDAHGNTCRPQDCAGGRR